MNDQIEKAGQAEKTVSPPGTNSLSKREYQVLSLLASGLGVKQIADKIFLSVKTVSTYRCRILEKLGLRNNNEAIVYAFIHGLTPVPEALAKRFQNAARWEMLMELHLADNKTGLCLAWYDVNARHRIDGLGGRDPIAIVDGLIYARLMEKTTTEEDEEVGGA